MTSLWGAKGYSLAVALSAGSGKPHA
ncbi:protein of unknown function [Azospirillum baldaniorum]|uniref:Uncharacterized protein n=1 Tax=Azospirillum baldaniorum TaxID=1064539 RepID=A0A9P1JSY3_9PROT|nr:protein of unknown function [Azospirillum baldaniorum]